MEKVHPYPIAVNGIKKVVILLSPSSSCWPCEQRLPPQPSALAVGGLTHYGWITFIFLTCSEDCQRDLTAELATMGRNPQSMQPAETLALLQARENIVGVVEGWQGWDRAYYLVRGPFFDNKEEESEVATLLGTN